MEETPTSPPRTTARSTSRTAIADPDPVPTTGAPDALTISAPVTKKRSLNDGPTGRARRGDD